MLDLVACAENTGDTVDLCEPPQVQDQDGSGCCFPSPNEIPDPVIAEMQAVQDACAEVFTPCFGENVTPMDLETCGFATPPCVSDMELCTAVEANGQGIVDPTACSAAGYCEIMEMMAFGQKVGEVCGPSRDNEAGRAAFSCSMDTMMEMLVSRMEARLVEMMDGFATSCPEDVLAACEQACESAIMDMIMADLPEDDDRAIADYVASMPESAVAVLSCGDGSGAGSGQGQSGGEDQGQDGQPTRLRCAFVCDGAVVEDIGGICALLGLVACAENTGDSSGAEPEPEPAPEPALEPEPEPFAEPAPPECTSDTDCHANATCVEEECECNSGFLGDGVDNCIEVKLPADVCVENEYASDGECLPCAAGETSDAMTGDTNAETGNTECTPTLCEANERVLANRCVACPAGTQSAEGADASGVDTQCTDIPTTGMCQGNTDSNSDVACGEGLLLKPDPATIEGTTTDECCDEMPDEEEDPPKVRYTWEATAWGVCEFKCGARASLTRTVKCMVLTVYSTGAVRREEALAENCEGDGPATTQECETLPVGTVCDDGEAATTGDACNADGECKGTKVLKSKLVFAVDTETIALPPADASPEEVAASPAAVALAGSIKDSLVASFGDGINVVILRILAGSLVVDYNVEIPPEVVVTQAVRESAAESIGRATPPELPAEDGGTVALPAPYVEPFKSYSYSRTTGCTAGSECSNACGYVGEVAADFYTCLEDGVAVAAVSCVDAGVGDEPQSQTVCCPPAPSIQEGCVQSAAQITAPARSAPPPPAELDCTAEDLTATEKANCLLGRHPPRKIDAPVAVVAIVAVVVLLIAVYVACKCCGTDDAKQDARPSFDAGAAREEVADNENPKP